MTRWTVETSHEFDKTLRKLDRVVARRVIAFLDELAALDDPRSRGKQLTGDLSEFWRYRIGDYRVLARIDDESIVIVGVRLGHRSRIY
ncbi:type II toxin-antitoxin system RelE/ParE family toxin [Herbiconiux sp. UC225_62]|uniref:type II toxin-antitoxin system RelE family toxin n=1 Tax=Herbiconiux sp. UC225_62 TaxID=3350168 RepID=UPI0036D285D9